LGDFNFVGGLGPETTLLTGAISDTGTFGPPIKGDWDNTDLLDVMPRDPFTRTTETWPSDRSRPSSRLDRFYVTDSVVATPTSFVFNPLNMNDTVLDILGINRSDAELGADHLPIVV